MVRGEKLFDGIKQQGTTQYAAKTNCLLSWLAYYLGTNLHTSIKNASLQKKDEKKDVNVSKKREEKSVTWMQAYDIRTSTLFLLQALLCPIPNESANSHTVGSGRGYISFEDNGYSGKDGMRQRLVV